MCGCSSPVTAAQPRIGGAGMAGPSTPLRRALMRRLSDRAAWLLLAVISFSTPANADELVVHCKGSGTPVFLIGGGPAFTTWHLNPIQERLKDRFRVCRWDMRGVGDNAHLPITATSPALAQWLADMRTVLPDQPVVLWGHSWGALQAMLFAKQHPQRVAALVLSNPVDPALRSLTHIETKRHVHDIPAALLSLDDIDTDAEERIGFRSKIASYFVDAQTGWRYSGQFSHADTNNALNVRIWDDYRRTPLTDADLAHLAPRIAGVIQCRHDVLMPETHAEYSRWLPADRQHMMDACAHFPWVEQPAAYYEQLLQILLLGSE